MKIPNDHTEIIELFSIEINNLIDSENQKSEQYKDDKYKEGYSRGCIVTLELVRSILFNLCMSYMQGKYGSPYSDSDLK